MQHPVVLFDGDCTLCTWSVQFIIKRDLMGRIRFASVQSPVGTAMLSEHGIDPTALDGVVVIDQSTVYQRTDAALRVTRYLSGWWPMLGALRVVPRSVRDPLYALIARNRYRWFGRRTSCLVPTPDLRRRFLDEFS